MDPTPLEPRRRQGAAGPLCSRLELLTTAIYLVLGMFAYLAAEPWVIDWMGAGEGRRDDDSIRLAAKGATFVLAAGAVLSLFMRSHRRQSPGTALTSPSNAQRFEWVARAVSDGMWDWDLQTNRMWRSEGYSRLFGYQPTDLKPGIESWIEALAPEDQDRVLSSLRQAIRTGQESWSAEYRFRTKSGTWLDVVDRAMVLRDEQGEPIRVVGGLVHRPAPTTQAAEASPLPNPDATNPATLDGPAGLSRRSPEIRT